jgi:hypothetical protein
MLERDVFGDERHDLVVDLELVQVDRRDTVFGREELG